MITIAGLMLFSGIQEMLSDYKVVKYMRYNLGRSTRDRLELVAALLYGSFDIDLTIQSHESRTFLC